MAYENWPVALYVPNLIGYIRVITGFASFLFALDDVPTAFWLYGISYALDAVDGVAARRLKQTSRWGAVLDMLTDRACTAALLCIRAIQEKSIPGKGLWLPYVYLMLLDVVSHWAQMYSSLASGAASHKNAKDEHPIIVFYYSFPYALFAICLFNEAFLVMDYIVASGNIPQLFAADVPANFLFNQELSVAQLIRYVCFPVFALKQIISVVQMLTAIKRILALDEADKRAAAAKTA